MPKSPKIRRICLYGGPGAGKSTVAAWLFSALKKQHLNIELVQEYVKTWSYENRPPCSFDQVYLLAKQMRKEDIVLRNNVDLIVTDSPIFLSTCYARRYKAPCWRPLRDLSLEFDDSYKPLNIMLKRRKESYSKSGRWQTLDEAIAMDRFIAKSLRETSGYVEASCDDESAIMEIVEGYL